MCFPATIIFPDLIPFNDYRHKFICNHFVPGYLDFYNLKLTLFNRAPRPLGRPIAKFL